METIADYNKLGLTEKDQYFMDRNNQRYIWDNEIVFDVDNRDIGFEAINFIGSKLIRAGYRFEIWYARGQKSPHLHVKDICFLDLDLNPEELKKYKELFIKKYAPEKYMDFVDFSLCPKHKIAEEDKPHYKYGTPKKLLWLFNKDKINRAEDELIIKAKKMAEKTTKLKKQIQKKIKGKIGKSIIEIAKNYGIVIKGNMANCPFHNEKIPSLSLDDAKGIFHCFGCGMSGNIVDFIYELRKLEKKNGS